MRLTKDEWEVAEMQKAIDVTEAGFDEMIRALPRAKDHWRGERVLEGVFHAKAREEGNGLGYETIAAAGNNANTLHWITNDGVVRDGDLILIDAGAEVDSLYTADITRTLPISGTFTDTQREVYDAVLETMWAWDIGGKDVNLRDRLSQNPKQHTGFVSMARGGVYADKDIALTYVADPADALSLLENEEAAAFLRTLADPDVRKILRYLQENRGIACTVPSVGAKCGIPEENARNALEALVRYNLSQKQTIDMGTGERIDVYSHWGTHKFPLLIYPLLTLAERLSDFWESWCGFRC